MIETHPFGNFVPPNSKYFLLGSFTTKPFHGYQWFYANGRNKFWPILEQVYNRQLDTKNKQQQLFIDLNMALADIIYQCERLNNSNLDTNLTNIVYNTEPIKEILAQNPIEKVFVTSRFVESQFLRLFSDFVSQLNRTVELIYLPSPSPRYAAISFAEKVERYQKLLPPLS